MFVIVYLLGRTCVLIEPHVLELPVTTLAHHDEHHDDDGGVSEHDDDNNVFGQHTLLVT